MRYAALDSVFTGPESGIQRFQAPAVEENLLVLGFLIGDGLEELDDILKLWGILFDGLLDRGEQRHRGRGFHLNSSLRGDDVPVIVNVGQEKVFAIRGLWIGNGIRESG